MNALKEIIESYKIKTITRDLVIRLSSIITIIIFVIGSFFYYASYNKLEKNLEMQINEYAVNLAEVLASPVWSLDHYVISHISLAYMQSENIVKMKVYDDAEIFFEKSVTKETDLIEKRKVIKYKNEKVGLIDLSLSKKHLSSLKRNIVFLIMIFLVFILLAIIIFTSLILQKHLNQPLSELQNGIEKIAAGDYSNFLSFVPQHDINMINQKVNDMAEAIKNNIEKLKLSQKRFRSISENISVGVFRIQHEDQNHFIEVNDVLVKMFNYSSRDEIISEKLDMIFKNIIDKRMFDEELFTLGMMKQRSFFFKKKSGDLFEGSVTANAITDDNDTIIYYDGFISDVTEQKKIEEIFLQAEKNMMIGGLSEGISHELKNPLSIIHQSSALIKERLKQENNKNVLLAIECGTTLTAINMFNEKNTITHCLKMINDSCEHSFKTIENILSFTRAEQTKFSRHQIEKIITSTVELVKMDSSVRRVLFEYNYEDSDVLVECQQNLLQQVFMNLIKNAAQSLMVKEFIYDLPKIQISTAYQDNQVQIAIIDNGPGIPDEIVDKIFNPFFTTKKSGEGTGLGLSISKFIITDTHKGSLSVFSDVDGGTRFLVSLPIKSPINRKSFKS